MTMPSLQSDPSNLPALTSPVPLVHSETSATAKRMERTFEQLDQLWQELEQEDGYQVPQLDYALPANFRLSVVIPVYNEQQTLRTLLGRVFRLPVPKEVILVDDCSTDGTRAILSELAGCDNVRIIYKPQNEGKGAALRTGFSAARGDVVVVQDADLEYDPRDIVQVIKPIVLGQADVVYGSRFLGEVPQDPSWLHRFGNRVLTVASNLLTGLEITDMETCYKAFRRDVLGEIRIEQNRFGFEPEITAKVARRGYRVCEVPISYHARSYMEGKKIGLKDAFNAFYCILRYGLRD